MSRFILRPFGQQTISPEEIVSCAGTSCIFRTASGKKVFMPPLQSLHKAGVN